MHQGVFIVYRETAISALVQFAIITLGYVGVGIALKFNGYPEHHDLIRWNSVSIWIREQGGWLYILPVVWAIYDVVSKNLDSGFASQTAARIIGYVVIFSFLMLFCYGMFVSHPHRWLW